MSRVERARTALARPGAWITEEGGAYAVRVTADRRRRPLLRLDEADLAELIRDPGLVVRPDGGWAPRRASRAAPDAAGRPGRVEGERTVMEPDGAATRRRAVLTPTALAWLAERKGPDGRPWLTPAERAAGERLTLDAETALSGPALTLRWDGLPRAGSGGGGRREPGDRAHAAGRRVEAALRAAGPRLRPVLEAVCVRGSALHAAETDLGLRRSAGRDLLRAGLQALARHYGMG